MLNVVEPDDHGDATRAEQRNLVRAGYDAISFAYRDDGGESPSTPGSTTQYGAWIDELASMLRNGDRVLDLGCGAGLPAARLLAEAGLAVTGIDISAVQIERARALVPAATFIEADMTAWEPLPHSFEAIVSLYALIHVPLEDQRRLIPRLAHWLTGGGLLLTIVGQLEWTGVEQYLGAEMFWDHADADTYKRWLQEAGFSIVWSRFIPEGSSGHCLILARNA
jgi:cyclopropane fatty-acyl-phospholipid synthase-like methyltransferase